jgi:hypothetical protein
MIETDLFEFAYVPDWYGQLEQLAEMALSEAWRFRKPQTECKNTDTPILERYLHMMFRKLSIDYNTCGKQLCLLSYRTVHKAVSGNLRLL